MSNLMPEKRLNKNGVAVTKYVLAATSGASPKSPIPAPATGNGAKAEQYAFSADEMQQLGDIISESTDEERSYHYLFLAKGDIDGLRLLRNDDHDPSTTYNILNTLEDLGLSSPEDTLAERQVKVDLHTPFYESGLIDYAAYGADGDRNEDLVKLVDENAGQSLRLMELMREHDLWLAEELRTALKDSPARASR